MISEAERPPLQSQLFFQRRRRRIDPGHIVDNPMAVVFANRGHAARAKPLNGTSGAAPGSRPRARRLAIHQVCPADRGKRAGMSRGRPGTPALCPGVHPIVHPLEILPVGRFDYCYLTD